MKKALFFVVVVLICVLCVSCDTPETQLPETTEFNNTTTVTPTDIMLTVEPSLTPVVDENRQIVYYMLGEGEKSEITLEYIKRYGNFVDRQNDIITINETIDYRYNVEENMPDKRTWEFMGNTYELEYKFSTTHTTGYLLSDIVVDYYESDIISDEIKVAFERGSDKPYVVESAKVSLDSIKTYDEYIEFITLQLSEYYDLSDLSIYEVDVTTIWYDFDKKLQSIKEFYIGESGEDIVFYSFYFRLKNGNNLTNNRISVTVSPKYLEFDFSCNIVKHDYKEIIKITAEEKKYACRLVNEFYDIYAPKRQSYKKIKDASFNSITVVNGRVYLVCKVGIPYRDPFVHMSSRASLYTEQDEVLTLSDEFPIEELAEYLTFYVDYERLQQKMALDKKT